jgi:opacity protein-like surface antigen
MYAAAAGVALVAGSGAASAQDFGGGSWYLKGFGGATWPSGEEEALKLGGTNTASSLKFDYDTGYTLGASVGYFVTANIAIEGEYAYRNASVSTTAREAGTSEPVPSNDGVSNSIMFNALYYLNEMGPNGAWQPYFGGGIGGAEVSIDAGDASWDSDTLFAYQLIAGVGYDVSPQWTLFGETRWYASQSGEFDGPDDLNFDSSFQSFDLLVGASYNF